MFDSYFSQLCQESGILLIPEITQLNLSSVPGKGSVEAVSLKPTLPSCKEKIKHQSDKQKSQKCSPSRKVEQRRHTMLPNVLEDNTLDGTIPRQSSNSCNNSTLNIVDTWKVMVPKIQVVINEEGSEESETIITSDIEHHSMPKLEESGGRIRNECVSIVYVQDWLIDDLLCSIIFECFSKLRNLNMLCIRRAGVNGDRLNKIIATQLPPSLTTLYLENNPAINSKDWDIFFNKSDIRLLTSLSLRYNALGDEGVDSLSTYVTSSSCSLKKLSLAGNRITCEGATALANTLVTNETIEWMDLSGNRIGSFGASALAQAVTCVKLDDPEMLEKRRVMLESRTMITERKKSNDSQRKKNEMFRRGRKAFKMHPSPTAALGGKAKPSNQKQYEKEMISHVKSGNSIWVLGNRCLKYLNLSQNLVGPCGKQCFLSAAKYINDSAWILEESGGGSLVFKKQ